MKYENNYIYFEKEFFLQKVLFLETIFLGIVARKITPIIKEMDKKNV